VEPRDRLPAGAGGDRRRRHFGPKGLRHGCGVQAVSKDIALNMVQKWLGHAHLTATAIYANAQWRKEPTGFDFPLALCVRLIGPGALGWKTRIASAQHVLDRLDFNRLIREWETA
jgi:hypothetical protein